MTIRRTLTHWGAMEVEVNGAEVMAVAGHGLDPEPTDIVDPIRHRLDGRITEPSVRRSWLEQGPLANPERRGDEPLVPVSWDVALDLAAEALRRVRRERGSSAIFGGSCGWGSAGRFHHPQSQLKRFLNAGGGFTGSRGTYSHGAAEVVVPAVTGMFRRLPAHRPHGRRGRHFDRAVRQLRRFSSPQHQDHQRGRGHPLVQTGTASGQGSRVPVRRHCPHHRPLRPSSPWAQATAANSCSVQLITEPPRSGSR